jgi:2-phospho-L-lactate transferase/gluconeogenesis factor (CofD/UPF0052 family)
MLQPPTDSWLESPGSSVFDLPINSAASQPPRISVPASPVPGYTHQQEPEHSFVVISGGTGGNAICSAFGSSASYVLPVSDDGGSSSEIIRVLGGPSIGDIRSRLIRLIPRSPPSSPLDAIRNLLAYRLPARCTEHEAREQWREIVEGKSQLWNGIPKDRKEAIRGFLVHFEREVLKRAHREFSFVNGSIGNYFLAAAQDFFRSLPSAIFLFASITSSQATILPVIVTSHTVTIAAELENGARLVGQCEISHPVRPSAQNTSFIVPTTISPPPESPTDGMGGTIAAGSRNVLFEQSGKDGEEEDPLPARIRRIYYLNGYGSEVYPSPNPDFIGSLNEKDVLVYSCGSLWTSIMPVLALRGVAAGIARSMTLRAKVLLLNSKNDRETYGYTATDYIHAIADTLNTHYPGHPYSLGNANTRYPISAFITDVVHLKGGEVPIDVDYLTKIGVRCTVVESNKDAASAPLFTPACVRRALEKVMSATRAQ